MRHRGTSKLAVLIALVIAIAIGGAVVAIVMEHPLGGHNRLGSQYTYDWHGLDKTDPKLILYHQVAAFDTGFEQATAIMIDDDDQVDVGGDHAVKLFDLKGRLKRKIDLKETPTCLAIGLHPRDVCVGFKTRFAIYGESERILHESKEISKDSYFTAIAIQCTDVFVADAGRRIVVHFSANGAACKVVREIGRKDENAGSGKDEKDEFAGFIVPSKHMDLAIDKDDLLHVANPGCHEIETFTFDGKWKGAWGEQGSGIESFMGCCNPTNFAIMPDGGFVTSEKGLPRVKLYSHEGHFVGVVAGPEQFARSLYTEDAPGIGLAVTSDGTICVLDPFSRQVRLFTKIKK
jgi:hypothetical protein